jgi:sulfite reductase alpha subunit-like flavoprotein
MEIQELAVAGNETHTVILYLGCKSKSTQFIYKQYVERLIAPNSSAKLEFQYLPESYSEGPYIIKQMFAAFSRDQAQKRTLRDILFTQQENLWESIYKDNGYVMVSGSSSMGKSVKECLNNIASEHLGEESGKYLEKLMSQNKFIEEVWD